MITGRLAINGWWNSLLCQSILADEWQMLCCRVVFTVLPYHLCQVIASQLDPDYMIHTILDRFHVLDLLTFSPSTTVNARRKVVLSRDHELPMLESALTFLCMLLGERTKLGTATYYCLIFAIIAILVAFVIINYSSRSVLSGFIACPSAFK